MLNWLKKIEILILLTFCVCFLFFFEDLHTLGPLDGSLYATILKSPKSTLKSPIFPPDFISNIVNNNYQRVHQPSSDLAIVASTPKSQRSTSTQSLISPPPEFSNKKLVEIKEYSPDVDSIGAQSQSNAFNRDQSRSISRSYTSTPSYEEIQVPSRNSSREATLRHQLHYQTAPRPSSSLSVIYHQQELQKPELPLRSSSVSRSEAHQQQKHLRTVDTYQNYNATQHFNNR